MVRDKAITAFMHAQSLELSTLMNMVRVREGSMFSFAIARTNRATARSSIELIEMDPYCKARLMPADHGPPMSMELARTPQILNRFSGEALESDESLAPPGCQQRTLLTMLGWSMPARYMDASYIYSRASLVIIFMFAVVRISVRRHT